MATQAQIQALIDEIITGGNFPASKMNPLLGNLLDFASSGQTLVYPDLVANDTTMADTTLVLEYGVNIVVTSTVTDYACRLPLPVTGSRVFFINNSLESVSLFPSMAGGQINDNPIDDPAIIPSDGNVYEFICIEGTNFGTWTYNIGAPTSDLQAVCDVDNKFNQVILHFNAGTYTVGLSNALNPVGSGNTFVGWNSLQSATGSDKTAIGKEAGKGSIGTGELMAGRNAGTDSDADNSVFVGNNAGSFSVTTNSVAIGEVSLIQATGIQMTAVGDAAGYISSASQLSAVGCRAGYQSSNTAGAFLGYSAGESSSGAQSIGIGTNAIQQSTANYTTGIGASSLNRNTGFGSIGIGKNAGAKNTGANSLFLGLEAGYLEVSDTGNTIAGAVVFAPDMLTGYANAAAAATALTVANGAVAGNKYVYIDQSDGTLKVIIPV
jgi:hypothetical protein